MGQIFIAALKEETPNLKDFHYSGVGKINATIKIMELISKFQPNEIINCLLYTSDAADDL